MKKIIDFIKGLKCIDFIDFIMFLTLVLTVSAFIIITMILYGIIL